MQTRVSFRFSLRTLLAVTLVIAIVLAWWAEQARETKWLAAELQRHGAHVTYEAELRRSHHTVRWFVPSYQTPLYDRLFLDFRCKWPEFFSHISMVSCPRGELPVSVKRSLARLSRLRSLNVNSTDFGDDDIRKLSCSASLEWLECEATKVTDDGMQCLARFTRLKTLDLQRTLVTDEGLSNLTSLKSLETLRIRSVGENSRQRISSEAVERLKTALPNCSIAGTWRLPQP